MIRAEINKKETGPSKGTKLEQTKIDESNHCQVILVAG